MAHHVALLSAALLLGLTACGQGGNPTRSSSPSGGSLDQGLQVSPDASVTTATYAVSGPNGFASAGTIPVGDSPDVPVTLSGLPVGQGYQIDVSGTASDGVTVCDGTATFDVVEGAASLTVIVHLSCAVPTGDVVIEATLNICPVVDGLSAAPTTLNIGGVSSLSVVAHDSDAAPAAISYSWAVNGVKLPRQTSPLLTFACSSHGDVLLSASVSDGDATPGCPASSSVKVTCE